MNDGKTHCIGPDLKGVAGRKIGNAEGFDYSDILSIADGNWTRDRLDEFLSDPQAYAPGTTMQMAPITDTAKRKALVDYLYSNP